MRLCGLRGLRRTDRGEGNDGFFKKALRCTTDQTGSRLDRPLLPCRTPNGVRLDPESGLIFSPSHSPGWIPTFRRKPAAGLPGGNSGLVARRHMSSCSGRKKRAGKWQALGEQVQGSLLSFSGNRS